MQPDDNKIGISDLGIFISTLGTALIESRLSSLGIQCKRKDEHNDKELATTVKEFYFQYYKTAYDSSNTEIIDESLFN